ncbi:hypothetical protein DFLDMN_001505 [Cupriavidus sp. H19C3]|uniref:hypothetical protein n=1 Tax=Cupriavidus sp. H19C3 TaxID=3241603 RepID=UPI003BF8CF38
MIVTQFTRGALRYRREVRDMTRDGWERIQPGGQHLLLAMHCGGRQDERISDVRIACDGKSLWVKTAKRER